MKDYKRRIFWLDYFNSSLSREQGRRIPLDRSVKDPKLDELIDAVKRLGYSPESLVAKHPKRMNLTSGLVSIEKRKETRKGPTLSEVARSLATIRGERSSSESKTKTLKH